MYSQNLVDTFKTPDSLQELSFDELYKDYIKTWPDTLTSKTYLYSFLKKAKQENNQIKMAQAYCLLSYYSEKESEKIKLLNRSIELSKGLGDKTYPVEAYSFKGGYYMKKGNYSKALDSYLKALPLAEKVNHIEYIYITKHNIGLIKTEIGKYDEALPLFRDNHIRNSKKQPIDTTRFTKSSIALGTSYRYNNKLDSASTIHRKAIQTILGSDYHYKRFYATIIINEGINLFFKKEYEVAQDSILKGVKLIDKNGAGTEENQALAAFYLGKLKLLENDIDAAQQYFKTVDSVLQKKMITPLEVREGYEHLINFYKANDQKEKQLAYINKLLRFDSIVNREASFVASRLFKEFDTPILLKEKEKLINELKGDNKNLNFLVFLLLFFSGLIGLFLYWQYKKRRIYQQKFEELMHQKNAPKVSEEKSKDDIGVPKEVVEQILNKLLLFEEKKQFLKKNISTTSLAKDIKTNTKYLSKVINHHKQKNFANYINDLRINYAVDRLKTDKALQNYTIQGIAEEMGFNTAESFSSAFKKTTGIKTSYFIKKLNSIDRS
ncbi:helix-turn-helix domain-containing protein [Aquimarina gracilis]|uniref:Helix-turn-helix domain-containing protein n=1 Tax=Aquimarina gracilis TaxID=874422 RepID=A0ABU6A193_9FLAO|nr:helix-turn-helix domain-containing protein [Aquimarina gracilis]MEB3347853.1 helix-turn-helix domain-containing protein [Aquimarina gracilis]